MPGKSVAREGMLLVRGVLVRGFTVLHISLCMEFHEHILRIDSACGDQKLHYFINFL